VNAKQNNTSATDVASNISILTQSGTSVQRNTVCHVGDWARVWMTYNLVLFNIVYRKCKFINITDRNIEKDELAHFNTSKPVK
jgi:hypothetical protein